MRELPVPDFHRPERVGEVWRVPYEERAQTAVEWAEEHDISPATADSFRVCLVAVDVQNTFCIPDFELFVAGRSGTGAVDDNRRLCCGSELCRIAAVRNRVVGDRLNLADQLIQSTD